MPHAWPRPRTFQLCAPTTRPLLTLLHTSAGERLTEGPQAGSLLEVTMFGFLIGTASLIGLIYVLRGGACGRGFHSHGFGHRHHHRGFGRWGWGRGYWLGGLFERLDPTREQEREIRSALDELFDAGRA